MHLIQFIDKSMQKYWHGTCKGQSFSSIHIWQKKNQLPVGGSYQTGGWELPNWPWYLQQQIKHQIQPWSLQEQAI